VILDNSDDELRKLASQADCRFYQVMESIKHCGEKNYLTSYGYKYCTRFLEYEDLYDFQVIIIIYSPHPLPWNKIQVFGFWQRLFFN
jgi:hypothetical protein